MWSYDRLFFEIYLAVMRHGSFTPKDISRSERRAVSRRHRRKRYHDLVQRLVEIHEGLMLLINDTTGDHSPVRDTALPTEPSRRRRSGRRKSHRPSGPSSPSIGAASLGTNS